MMFTDRLIRALGRLAIVAGASAALAGCYDVDTTLTMKPDGTSAVTSRFDFPRDAKYVADLYKAIMQAQPGLGDYFDEGLCQSVEKLAALNAHKPIALKAREYTTEERFGCGFLYEAGSTADLVDNLRSAPASTGNVFKLEEVGPRRVRIEIDFSNLPDLKQMMPGLIMLGAMKYGNPAQGLPDREAIDKITKAYIDASLAMARMSAANNHLQFAIKAAKVIETNGERDGDLVRFRWSWEDFTRLMLKPADGPAAAKTYFAVVEY